MLPSVNLRTIHVTGNDFDVLVSYFAFSGFIVTFVFTIKFLEIDSAAYSDNDIQMLARKEH